MESQFFLVMSGLFSGFSVSVTSFLGERVYIYICIHTYIFLYLYIYIYIYTYKCIRSQCRNCRNYKFGNLKLIFVSPFSALVAVVVVESVGGCSLSFPRKLIDWFTGDYGETPLEEENHLNQFPFFVGSIRSSSGYILGRSLKISWHQHRSKH